jgi:hypothetical protein
MNFIRHSNKRMLYKLFIYVILPSAFLLLLQSCKNDAIKIGVVNTSKTYTIKAVVVNKLYNVLRKEYSIFYKNDQDGIYKISGKLVNDIHINDSIKVVFTLDTLKKTPLSFTSVEKVGQSDKLELINIK